MDAAGGDERIARVLRAFTARYVAATPYRQDRELAGELAIEARPAVESLLVAAAAEPAERARVLDHHEGLALVTLLGRRAGVLGATPTAAIGVVRALFGAFEETGDPLPRDLEPDLTTLCVEGYVAGREERLVDTRTRESADAQAVVHVAQGCVLLFLAGDHTAEMLERIVDRFAREMLKSDARAGLVDLTRLDHPEPDKASEVFGADAAARMLGARCIFVGVTDAWREAARVARVETSLLTIEPTFADALRHALSLAGWELRPISKNPLRALLRR